MDNFNDLYTFVGWFVCVRSKNDEIVTYCQVSKVEFIHVLDEAKIFSKKKSTVLKYQLVKDRDWLHMDYFIDDFLIGYAEFMTFDDFFEVI